MKILAIDTSCDESCAALFDTEAWKFHSDIIHSHVTKMKEYGGVVPEIASREHLKALPLAVSECLRQAKLTAEDLDWITVTHRPGLIGALLVGVAFAKTFAFSLGKPFSVINHIDAHLFSPLIGETEGGFVPPFPWLALVVSGGHTELFHVRDSLDYEWLGGTLDDAAGEAFDKIGKLLGFSYPAGPQMDNWIREKATMEDRRAFKFPIAKTDGFDFSFSGLKTSVANQVQKLGRISETDKVALASSAQEAIVNALIGKLESAQKSFPEAKVVITGGVACNSRLRERASFAYFPKKKHCTDNAAMVAMLCALQHRQGKAKIAPWTTTAHPSYE